MMRVVIKDLFAKKEREFRSYMEGKELHLSGTSFLTMRAGEVDVVERVALGNLRMRPIAT